MVKPRNLEHYQPDPTTIYSYGCDVHLTAPLEVTATLLTVKWWIIYAIQCTIWSRSSM